MSLTLTDFTRADGDDVAQELIDDEPTTTWFQTGVTWLRGRLITVAGEPVEVRRNGELIGRFKAVTARSQFEDVDQSGMRVTVYIVDFLIPGETEYRPLKNDEIVYAGKTYSVRPLGREVWRYDDPYEEMVRIHAQLR